MAHRFLQKSYWDIRLFILKKKLAVKSGPFDFKLYYNLLNKLINSPNDIILDFDSDQSLDQFRNWYIRHDIDMPECLSQVEMFLDFELGLGLKPACFIRINSPAYENKKIVHLVKKYSDLGVIFGLHSECYLDDLWRERFEIEISIFREIYGFVPSTFNVHGFGAHRLRERLQFYDFMTHEKVLEYGFSYSDLHNGLRDYKYCIQDSNASTPSSLLEDYRPERRQLFNDFLITPPIKKGTKGLILTHPGYWK